MITSSLPISMSDLAAVDFKQLVDELVLEVPVLIDKIKKGALVEEEDVKPLLIQVVCFLFLISRTNQKLTPSHRVDMAWHEFILCTKLYHRFCDTHFERFIHHHPGGKEESNQEQFQLTHQMYRKLIGIPPERFWGKNPISHTQSDCGVCEAI